MRCECVCELLADYEYADTRFAVRFYFILMLRPIGKRERRKTAPQIGSSVVGILESHSPCCALCVLPDIL